MITLSLIKADIGGYVGHSSMHPSLMEKGRECMEKDDLKRAAEPATPANGENAAAE